MAEGSILLQQNNLRLSINICFIEQGFNAFLAIIITTIIITTIEMMNWGLFFLF